MSGQFDPDAYLKGASAGSSSGFDPDAYLGKTKEKPSEAKSLIGGAYQGVLGDFGDELGGVIGKLLMREPGVKLGKGAQLSEDDTPRVRAEKEKLLQMDAESPTNYELVRNGVRKDLNAAQEEHPEWYAGGQVAGGLAMSAVPGLAGARYASAVPKLTKAIGALSPLTKMMAGGAAYGGLSGAGASEAESASGVLGDAALGASVGAAAGAGGRLLGKAAEKGGDALRRTLGPWAMRGEKAAAEGLDALADKSVRAAESKAAGLLGGETQKGNRFVENLMRLEERGNPKQKAAIKALRESGTLQELEERLLDSTLDEIPGQKGVIDSARAQLSDLTSRRPELLAEARKSASSVSAQVKPRLQRYAAPIATAALGSSAGGIAGLLAGGDPSEVLGGALLGAGIRPSIQAVRRMVQHPAVAQKLFQAAGKLVPAERAIAGKKAGDALRNLVPRGAPKEYGAALLAMLRGDDEDPTASR